MKGTKFYLIFMGLALVLSCSNTDDSTTYSNSNGRFVRFFALVNSNNDLLEFPEINGRLEPVSLYEKTDIETLKIPVALTSEKLSENVTVNFETTISEGLNNIAITPSNILTFTPEKLVDTIYVRFNERWDVTQNPEITFKLIDASDPTINLGIPNSVAPNNELTVVFGELNLTYGFENPNQKEILGTVGETVDFSVIFPNGYIGSEILAANLISESLNGFDYNLIQLPLENLNKVSYRLTLNENIAIDELEFRTSFELNELEGYTQSGSSSYRIIKPIRTVRDVSVNTAGNFYDLSDPFYRTFGVNWMDFNTDDICEWRDFNTFTFPVVVDADDPNAILFNDMGTTNPEDDIYHHAFRVGFISPISGNTTSPFNLKRWFNNESTSAANSPGFNIVQALEFFPENGNSTTNGFVQVIEQDIVISGTNGNTYVITISGSGTYNQITPGIFEIQLEFTTFNTDLFGGIRSDQYRIYNTQDFVEPAPLNIDCFIPIDL